MRIQTGLLAPLLLVAAAYGQPVASSAVNAASYASRALPNGGLAQGGMFLVFGTGLGPAQIEIVAEFPLPTGLQGTSVKVTVGAVSVDCIMAYTLATQVAAVLPSTTPLGPGTLTVTFNGQTSAAIPITVVESSFGIFALNQGGSGPGIFTTPGYAVNTLLAAGNPGSLWFIWGTGLGPVTGDEAGGALPGDLTDLDVKVLVGGQPAVVSYRGRSGCCVGLDQILIELPAGVTGCYVPVVVIIGGVPSNYTTISIAPEGNICSDPGGLSTQVLTGAQTAGTLAAGNITLLRQNFRTPLGPGFADIENKTDTATAGFASFAASQFIATQRIASISNIGACAVYQFQGIAAERPEPVPGQTLDAGGGIILTGPKGVRQLPKQPDGSYAGKLGGSSLPIPGIPGGGGEDYLEPGEYAVNNGNGAGVGAFTASLTLGETLTPTNLSELGTVERATPLTLTWTGGDSSAYVQISGSSAVPLDNGGAAFVCRAPAAAGSFTVTTDVLSALPASGLSGGVTTGRLSIGTVATPTNFTATGLAFGQLGAVRLETRRSSYE